MVTSTNELVPAGEIHVAPLLPMSVEAAEGAMDAYQELTRRLLTVDDWQGRPGQHGSFVKRRGWAKLATFYNVTTELLRETIDRDPDGQVIRARVVARAIAPNGRHADGDGACSIDEARFASKGGRQKIEHDLPATATTRAVNRAISNLIGFGEVSAEEVDDAAPDELPGTTAGEPAPLDLVTPDQRHDVLTHLQERWPAYDAHGFLRVLAKRLETPDVPVIAARALSGWAWWTGRPEATGNLRAQDEAAAREQDTRDRLSETDPAAQHAAWATEQQAAADTLDQEPEP